MIGLIRRQILPGVILAMVWGVPSELQSAQSAALAIADTVLLTHPRASVIDYYVQLARSGVLDARGLRLKGIYHEAETEDYTDACDYLLEQGVEWISLERVGCELTPATIYQRNDCSEAFDEMLESSVGLIVSGGPDLPPQLYNHPPGPTTRASVPARHRFEVALLHHLLMRSCEAEAEREAYLAKRPCYAVMGICGGMQCMNVAAGGTLTQDIASEIYGHADGSVPPEAHVGVGRPGAGAYHAITFTDTFPSALRQALPHQSESAPVLSIHHQAIQALGPSFEATATTLDGRVIEAIAHVDYPHVMGWQFHPELPALWSGSSDKERQEAQAFAAAIWANFLLQVESSASH